MNRASGEETNQKKEQGKRQILCSQHIPRRIKELVTLNAVQTNEKSFFLPIAEPGYMRPKPQIVGGREKRFTLSKRKQKHKYKIRHERTKDTL